MAKNKTGNVFERIEKKYMLTREKYNRLLEELEAYMSLDSYGKHTIGNIYYDTDTYELIRYSIEKPVYKRIKYSRRKPDDCGSIGLHCCIYCLGFSYFIYVYESRKVY